MAAAELTSTDPTLVNIESGTIRGVAAGDLISLKDIPYRAARRNLRWRVPQPRRLWALVHADR